MQLAVAAHDRHWHWNDLCRAAGNRYRLNRIDLRQLQIGLLGPAPRVEAGNLCLNDFPALLLLGIPGGSLEQVVFRMDALATLESLGVRVLNPPKAIEASVDKYLTLQRLLAAGLPIPRTHVCQGVDEALETAERLGGDVVLKPLFGSEGKGLQRPAGQKELRSAVQAALETSRVIYLQQFIPHGGWDLRLLVIGSRIWAMKRSNPHDWRTNASRGATVSPWPATAREKEFAFQAAAAVGAPIAGVDLVYDREGHPYLLELNSAPGWKYISAATGSDIAAELLAFSAGQTKAD